MTRTPHVCFLAPNAYPLLSGDRRVEFIGGAELQQVIIAGRLAQRGLRVSMICLDYGQEDRLEIGGITVYRAFRPTGGIPVLRFFWPRLSSIWSCMKRADADIYYQRAAGLWTGVMVAYCKNHGKKSIFAAAGNPDLELNTPRVRLARDRWIYLYGLRHVDRILVQNDEQARLCRANLSRDSVRIPNCYPMPDSRWLVRSNYVLWVSTIRKLKRPELFLDLAESLPNQQFRMIGGSGRNENALFESIRLRAQSIRNLEFLGFIPYSSIDEQFDGATLLVNTSESEGFPNSFLQAWARGIPTVSYVDAGASLDGRPVGIKVGSLEEMTATVAALSSNGELRLEVGGRCAHYVENHHSPERVLDLYGQVFEELMRPDRDGTKIPSERPQ